MLNLDAIANKNNKDDDKNWPYRILIIRPSGSGKNNALLNLIQIQNSNNPICLYAKDLSEPKYKFLIKKRVNAGIKNYNDPTEFTEYSNAMDDGFSNIDDYNPKRKRKILTVFDDMISDIMTNKRFQAIIKELFIRCRNLNISIVFITHSYFSVSKEARLNSTHHLIMKINNRKDLKQIAIDHSAGIDYKDFLKIYRNCTNERYSFLNIDVHNPSMKFTQQVKLLYDKLKANKAQYELDRKAAKISALSSGELEKYEYLTDEDLGCKLDVIQKVKSEYSPLGNVFNK